ncbi:TonB-dependent receptor family protein [Arsukibacterium sp.]|uniref:TonB-dependent receptor family protein n=1 Tax=Arsukibacterium sp. TaxID=1977258 RepID=UPI002FD8A567
MKSAVCVQTALMLFLASLLPDAFATVAGAGKETHSTEDAAEQAAIEVMVISAQQQPSRWLSSPASISSKTVNDWQLPVDSAQLLQGIAGLQADGRTNYAQDTRLSIRGFGTRSAFGVRGLYLTLDGIPLTNADGQSQLSSLLLSEVGRVEVLRGPLAVLYGNAAGGVVQLFSREQSTSEVSLASAHSSVNEHWDLKLNKAYEQQQWRFAAHQFKSDGERPQASAKRQQAVAQWQWQFAKGLNSRLRLDWSYDPLLLDPQGLSPADFGADPRQTHPAALLFNTRKQGKQLQLSWQLKPLHGQWQWQSWRSKRQINQFLAFSGDAITSSGGEIDLTREVMGSEAWYRWQLNADLSLQLGAQLEQSRDRRFGYVNNFGQRADLRRDELGKVNRQDVYLRSQWQASNDWLVTGGVRHSALKFSVEDYFMVPGNPDDSGRTRFEQSVWALGTSYQLQPELSLYASIGEGFETPTLSEMAYQRQGTGLNFTLQASTNQQAEVGLKWQAAQPLWFDISVFHIDSRNELVVDSALGGRTSYRNAAATRRQGVELQLDWQTSDSIRQLFSMTLMSAHYKGDTLDGKVLPGLARQSGYWQWQWQPWQDQRLALHLTTVYRGPVYSDDNNSQQAAAHWQFGLAAQSTLLYGNWQWQPWLQLDNLADRQYVGAVIVNQGNGRSYEPAAARSVNIGLRAQRAF